jgi:hypothetical protein
MTRFSRGSIRAVLVALRVGASAAVTYLQLVMLVLSQVSKLRRMRGTGSHSPS